jgi:hypothetical protein
LITTLGDADKYSEKDGFSPWNSSLLIGKVVARVPFIGNLPLFLHSEVNLYIFIAIILIILLITILPFGSNNEEGRNAKEKETSLKIDLNFVFFILLNALIVGFLIFSLWGSFTFWQPGADPPQATIRGMFSDLQFHETYSNEVYLSQGFLNYKIDWKFNGGVRSGVPTLSWFQFSLLILFLFNFWKFLTFMKMRNAERSSGKSF